MNIKDAKTEIKNTIRAYTHKDQEGHYTFPLIRQRPVLLMGPPGIGKTAIMEQVARECGIGLVAYTITHHTRQSAIGLPRIETREYQGVSFPVTEYTMSEIVASVYSCMETTGCREGILFIDEINCVSETLAPTMLQFLQNKTFGSHKVPSGWVIVAAGNPQEYNKSVREFDVVTLDRVKKIEVEADCSAWMEYAWENQVHGAVLSYLSIKKEDFYLVENTVDGKFFVTARGWEDLSQILKSYEEFQVPITENLVVQYLQKEEVARSFAAYYQLYAKYRGDYEITAMLEGKLDPDTYDQKVGMAQKAAFDERLSVVGLLLEQLGGSFTLYERIDSYTVSLHQMLTHVKEFLSKAKDMGELDVFIEQQRKSLGIKEEAQLISPGEAKKEERVLRELEGYGLELKKQRIGDCSRGFEEMKNMFQTETIKRDQVIQKNRKSLDAAFRFVKTAFGEEEEMILFVTGLSRSQKAMHFIRRHGCESYFRYSRELLFQEKEQELQRDIRLLQEQWKS